MYYYELYIDSQKQLYTYKSETKYNIGDWCFINFSNREKIGLIIKLVNEEELSFEKNAIKLINKKSDIISIPYDMMELAKWMINYYLSNYDDVIKTIYPEMIKATYAKKAIYISDIESKNPVENKLFLVEDKFTEYEKFNQYMKKKQEVNLSTLKKHFTKEIIQKATKNGNIKIEKKIINQKHSLKDTDFKEYNKIENKVKLNKEQEEISETIKNSNDKFFLLKGITGSGKTEVYIDLIKDALKKNKTSIFLVPEISLTSQMIEKLKENFDGLVAILHSKLTKAERRKEWLEIEKGMKKIVLGTRSAIFSPLKNIEYIIIDEEHENTYKQESNPRYHVKNIALKRALIDENIKIVFGSATPSFETYYQAVHEQIKLVELNERYNNAELPTYKVINLNDINENFSQEMLGEIRNTLERKEQAIIILNKKAFSTIVKCKDCGHVVECPNCSISLNYYKSSHNYKCNYCGYEKKYEDKCEKCGSEKLLKIGTGTEKIEQELIEKFPDARILRIDSESVKKKDDYDRLYHGFKDRKYDIMIGTQMIAKGFHFPNVTFVGIVNADIILHFPDFRAGEKTFQLLTQSSGRSGRGSKKGKVFIQTYDEKNDIILKTVENDYEGFYKNQLEIRKLFNYPPFGRLIYLIFSSLDEEILKTEAIKFYKQLNGIAKKDGFQEDFKNIISEPFRAPLYRINSRYRYQIFIKSDTENINKLKKYIRKTLRVYNNRNIRINVDVDPISLM